MGTEFYKIEDLSDARYDQAMEIYIQSFPPNERQNINLVRERIQSGVSDLYVGTRFNEVICFGMLWNFKSIDFVLLDYMAVKENFRGMKIGSELFQYLCDSVTRINKSFVFEVEHPAFGFNKREREKRINFYLKNGAFILDNFTYLLPPLHDSSPTEMILMVYPPGKKKEYSHKEIKELVISLYNDLYQRNSKDNLLQSFINTIPETITISKNTPHD